MLKIIKKSTLLFSLLALAGLEGCAVYPATGYYTTSGYYYNGGSVIIESDPYWGWGRCYHCYDHGPYWHNPPPPRMRPQ